MYIKKRYPISEVIKWTRYETIIFFFLAFIPIFLNQVFYIKWLQLPWTPIAVIGTAVAFVIGFQNNAAYGRIWEARKIWGGIINNSRSFTILIKDIISGEDSSRHIKRIVYRHLAWLTALRYAMRESRPWEVFQEEKTNKEWAEIIQFPERTIKIEVELEKYLSANELDHVMKSANKQTAIMGLQSKDIRELKDKGQIWDHAFLQAEQLFFQLIDLQGKTERIKNFPYPRQYATLNHNFVWTFIIFLPFAIIPVFSKIAVDLQKIYPTYGLYFSWLAVPFSMVVSWIFHTMERIGRVGENPFEGSANDIPISTISRGIEIDIKQLIGDQDIPKPLEVVHNVQR